MAAGGGSDYASISRPKQWEVPKRNVRLDKKLGSGHFGMVMKGFLKTKQGIQVVAVKMLKGWYVSYVRAVDCKFLFSQIANCAISQAELKAKL